MILSAQRAIWLISYGSWSFNGEDVALGSYEIHEMHEFLYFWWLFENIYFIFFTIVNTNDFAAFKGSVFSDIPHLWNALQEFWADDSTLRIWKH